MGTAVKRPSVPRTALVWVGVSAAVLLAGCSAPTASSPGSSSTPRFGAGMMGGGSGYSYSRLACAAPEGLPGQQVTVVVGDMGMTRMMGGTAPMGVRMMLRAAPATVPAGLVSIVVQNMGWRTHELVILPLAVGASDGQRVPGADGKVNERGSLGEASTSCRAGAGEGITSGSVGWTSVTLAPGRYELVCNLPNHYADGMHQELVVTG